MTGGPIQTAPVLFVHQVAMAHDQDAADMRISRRQQILESRQLRRIDAMVFRFRGSPSRCRPVVVCNGVRWGAGLRGGAAVRSYSGAAGNQEQPRHHRQQPAAATSPDAAPTCKHIHDASYGKSGGCYQSARQPRQYGQHDRYGHV